MSSKEARTPVPFSVMTGEPELFIAQNKKYHIKPMKIGDALKFIDDKVIIEAQIFNLAAKENREKINYYLSKYCTNEKGEPMSLESAITDDWDIVDLKKFVHKLCDISG